MSIQNDMITARDMSDTQMKDQALADGVNEIQRLSHINQNHLETLHGIASMDDPERMKLWATDALSGYTETAESTLLKVCDERNRLQEALKNMPRCIIKFQSPQDAKAWLDWKTEYQDVINPHAPQNPSHGGE